MSAEKYAAALKRMRQHTVGSVVEQEFHPAGEEPYRYATLGVKAPHGEAASAAYGMASVAVDIGGHLVMYTHADECWLQVSVSTELPAVAEAQP